MDMFSDSEKLSNEKLSNETALDRASDDGRAFDYQGCSWQKTTGLLLSEYICLAIMSFPWLYSVLGLVPGLIITVFVAATVYYTGLTVADYCIANPGITSVCDIGKHLFWDSDAVWYATAVCFICNNTLIQALHVLVGAKYFNTITSNLRSDGSTKVCSIVWGVVSAVICFVVSLPRTFSSMSLIAYFSAITMFVAVVLSMAFAGVEAHPNHYTGQPVHWNLWPEKGTSYVAAMGAVLNIVYTFVGQITYPSFISQMKRPQDFKKALTLVTALEVVVFALAGSIVYVYVGNGYITSPAFGLLSGNYLKIAFSFALPTILFLGALYSNVTSQFLFLHIFKESLVHRSSHTVLGWGVWVAINGGLWIIAFVVAEVIPFFLDLLSLMLSLFDCWFGFVFWGVAHFRLLGQRNQGLSPGQIWHNASAWLRFEMAVNVVLVAIGLYVLGPGLYATVESIIQLYEAHLYGNPFSCASNGF